MKYIKSFNESFKLYSKEQLKEIENKFIKIKDDSWERFLLNILPDYSGVKFTFRNEVGGLGYVEPFNRVDNKLKHSGLRFSGIPTPEIYTHELWHYFTIPALTQFQQNQKNSNSNIYEYTKTLFELYKNAKSMGYSVINGVSVHDNLNEFAVNITNQDSVKQLKKLGLFDDYFNCQKKYMNSLKK
jgi:hypothetical protein